MKGGRLSERCVLFIFVLSFSPFFLSAGYTPTPEYVMNQLFVSGNTHVIIVWVLSTYFKLSVFSFISLPPPRLISPLHKGKDEIACLCFGKREKVYRIILNLCAFLYLFPYLIESHAYTQELRKNGKYLFVRKKRKKKDYLCIFPFSSFSSPLLWQSLAHTKV